MRSVLKSLPLLLLLCVLATIGRGVAEAGYAPRPVAIAASAVPDTLRIAGFASFVVRAGEDSLVKLGTRVLNLTGFVAGDTLRFEYYAQGVGAPDTLLRTVRKVQARDSVIVPAPKYGATRLFKGCAQIERGGRTTGKVYPAAGPICWTWAYARPALPDPGMGGVERIVLRPLSPPLAPDRLTSCIGWQRAHPDSSVWRSASEVNRRAIPECSTDAQLMVWQLCAFGEDTAGAPLIAAGSSQVPFCLQEFESWKAERSV